MITSIRMSSMTDFIVASCVYVSHEMKRKSTQVTFVVDVVSMMWCNYTIPSTVAHAVDMLTQIILLQLY